MPTVKKQTGKKRVVKKTTTTKVPPKKKLKLSESLEEVKSWITPVELDDKLKICIYGRSGSGKTQLWGTFPGKILVLVCSGGNKLGELKTLSKETRERTMVVKIDSTEKLARVINYQLKTKEFDVVVLDHVSGLQDLTIKELLGIEKLPEQSSWGQATQQTWGQCSLRLKESLRALLNIDSDIVIIAQEREFSSGDDNDIILPYVGPALSPSSAGWLTPACDYVVQTFLRDEMNIVETELGDSTFEEEVATGKMEYCLRTAPHSIYQTKFRMPLGETGRIPDVIINPTHAKLMKIIQG